jgi:hypothetical protein
MSQEIKIICNREKHDELRGAFYNKAPISFPGIVDGTFWILSIKFEIEHEGKYHDVLVIEEYPSILKAIDEARKELDKADVPTEGRMIK